MCSDAVAEPAPELFEFRVAPVLESRCLRCHQGVTARGKFSLESAAAALRGGESGTAIVPGKPDESLLLDMIQGDEPEMPAEGEPLSAAEVADIRTWIESGAAWPESRQLRYRPNPEDIWWSLRPIASPAVPDHKSSWIRTPIDAFILGALEAKGLAPSPEADRRTLIRRVTFDLIGLPPTPEEVIQFVDDPDPAAYEQLVDRLLESPHYGERWGRHWLDVVHFGETHGYDKDKRREHAWRYRDYVIQSLNGDKPYGQFIREQIAGDQLLPNDPQGIVALGFIAAGPWDFVGHVELREDSVEKLKTRSIDRDDMVANTMSTFTSMTVHCARCHDHPFDPIPQEDYYRLQAVFAGVDRGDRELPALETTAAEIEALPSPPKTYSVVSHEPRPIYELVRGNVEAPGKEAVPGSLSAIAGLDGVFSLSEPINEASGRLALAQWLSDPACGLTWRSITNRVWQYHFGRGLVDTPNDFGRNGSLPSHPELLDWLAGELLRHGESLKQSHRLMVTSAVYRQASAPNAGGEAIDADNRLLWRMTTRRLEGEAVRDAVLAVSGRLDPTIGGPSFAAFEFEDDHSPRYRYVDFDRPDVWRRSVYRFIVRSVPDPWMEALDCPDPSLSAPVRGTTISAPQALAMWNDPFVIRQSEYFAQRLEAARGDLPAQIRLMYELALSRSPSADEQGAMEQYAGRFGLAAACRVLLNSNEFLFVD